jgi:glucans biosynthesis protein
VIRISNNKVRFRQVCLVIFSLYSIPTFSQTIPENRLPTESTPLLKRLVDDAKSLSEKAYSTPELITNEQLTDLSYSTYRAIRFNPEMSIWKDERPFEVQLFHSGFLYTLPTRINLVDWKNEIKSLPFDSSRFIYEKEAATLPESIKTDIGYAGFRIHYPLNSQSYKDEFAVFQGATYFRLIGENQLYGLSSRALAIDTAMPEGEEFPYFSEFWLVETDSNSFTTYARINSKSLTAVYKFVITPGQDTRANVKAWIFAREDIAKLGLAPFTSMFLYGENSLERPDDYRPEVHDSDGVLLHTSNNDSLWRALDNPNRLRITSLSDEKPNGFGMVQRDIQYDHYLDAEANYHRRPGYWVTVKEGFKPGKMEIVEIPTDSETHDNIVAYWVNNEPLLAGQSLYLEYDIQTTNGEFRPDNSLAPVLRTLTGENRLPGEEVDDDDLSRLFNVDFRKPYGSDFDISQLALDVSASNAQVSEARVLLTNFDSEIRVSFIVTPNEDDAVVDMRAFLTYKGEKISEIWTNIYER